MEGKSKGREILEWIYCILIALVIVILIKSFVGVPTIVKQSSMYPTLMQEERLWLSRWGATFNKMPKRGDIITFEAPTNKIVSDNYADLEHPVAEYKYNPTNIFTKFVYYTLEIGKTSYIKRVVGLPGDHVQIKDGGVYVNGERLEEKYLQDYVVTDGSNGAYTDIVVPENTVYVLGDNRGESTDSRRFGCIPVEKIESKAVFRFWPLNKIGGIYKDVK
ncbi:MAG: signal peptidase I [Clostridia bacterium]|nr:signal peptidase I [Clostridia bacterium]